MSTAYMTPRQVVLKHALLGFNVRATDKNKAQTCLGNIVNTHGQQFGYTFEIVNGSMHSAALDEDLTAITEGPAKDDDSWAAFQLSPAVATNIRHYRENYG